MQECAGQDSRSGGAKAIDNFLMNLPNLLTLIRLGLSVLLVDQSLGAVSRASRCRTIWFFY